MVLPGQVQAWHATGCVSQLLCEALGGSWTCYGTAQDEPLRKSVEVNLAHDLMPVLP